VAGRVSFYLGDYSGDTAIRDQRRDNRGREQKARVNRRIRVPQVRLIDEEGQQVGIISTADALRMAEERELDLVEVAPNADPPVCRLMDYGKFLYDQSKKEREARKKQKTIEVKEVQLSINIDSHHVEVKSNQARRFLAEGDKVKFSILLRGRQRAHPELGMQMLEQVAEQLRDVAVVEVRPQAEGRSLLMIVAPQAAKPAPKPRPPSPDSGRQATPNAQGAATAAAPDNGRQPTPPAQETGTTNAEAETENA
jgi:translation initiation factor IF-3